LESKGRTGQKPGLGRGRWGTSSELPALVNDTLSSDVPRVPDTPTSPSECDRGMSPKLNPISPEAGGGDKWRGKEIAATGLEDAGLVGAMCGDPAGESSGLDPSHERLCASIFWISVGSAAPLPGGTVELNGDVFPVQLLVSCLPSHPRH
jgi:hypothetical protein